MPREIHCNDPIQLTVPLHRLWKRPVKEGYSFIIQQVSEWGAMMQLGHQYKFDLDTEQNGWLHSRDIQHYFHVFPVDKNARFFSTQTTLQGSGKHSNVR